MLFTYGHLRHHMRAMHGFTAFIFARVWCRAPDIEYSIELFKALPSLYSIMDDLYRKDLAGVDTGAGAFFYRCINEIFLEFKNLSPAQIKAYRTMFNSNNDIQALCQGRKQPSRYPATTAGGLMDKIEKFFSKLYSGGFFDLAEVKKHVGADLRDHYKAFAEFNAIPCCPFCGLMPMDSELDPTREAYDHYLPSSKYPFNSVNLRNLAPSCYKCNSQCKGAKDPLLDDTGVNKKAFYPYNVNQYPIQVSVYFTKPPQLPTALNEIVIKLDCADHDEEIETWDRLYKIRARYAAKCLSTSGYKYWLQRILDEKNNYNLVSRDALTKELEICNDFPWHDTNFLKNAFLVESLKTSLLNT